MEFIINLAEKFIQFFQEDAANAIIDNIAGTIPVLLGLLFIINFLIQLIGERRVDRVASLFGRSTILSYVALPPIAWFFLSSPGALTLGKLIPERRKPGFQDALGTTVHPLTSLFPHIVPAELFIWLGIANGVTALGLSTMPLAIRAIIVALIVALIRGILTEKIFVYLLRKNKSELVKEMN